MTVLDEKREKFFFVVYLRHSFGSWIGCSKDDPTAFFFLVAVELLTFSGNAQLPRSPKNDSNPNLIVPGERSRRWVVGEERKIETRDRDWGSGVEEKGSWR
eukprot:Protomagalhaensia_wolfi_Nauph_80__1351@NODE_1806_length_1326_cov_2059_942502_g1409_i0_p2_GENE_NODE_1806_length_1326_cov_2059_942502_g1409_i0NODE_1806_length_1326_cov_2059_942502_g1409_i0_p2_ORF_typecomplete_len101_score16_13_NODE_1806_length_1326_cov_2059_942502_g1409_i0509811